jgi:hypothetical protein
MLCRRSPTGAARRMNMTIPVFAPTNTVAGIRFAFFLTQVVCMFWMGFDIVAGS